MKKIVLAGAIALAVALPASGAPMPNYGGLTEKQEARIIRIIKARFTVNESLAICIARRESGLNPRAVNWGDSNGGSHGLFQINGVHRWAFSSRHVPRYGEGYTNAIYNAYHNVNVAYRLSRGGRSWGPWGWAC